MRKRRLSEVDAHVSCDLDRIDVKLQDGYHYIQRNGNVLLS